LRRDRKFGRGFRGITLGSLDAVLTNSGGSAKPLQLGATAAGSTTFGASFKHLIPGTYTLALALDPSAAGAVTPGITRAIPATVTVASGAATSEALTITSQPRHRAGSEMFLT
jgi:hypothetical protein